MPIALRLRVAASPCKKQLHALCAAALLIAMPVACLVTERGVEKGGGFCFSACLPWLNVSVVTVYDGIQVAVYSDDVRAVDVLLFMPTVPSTLMYYAKPYYHLLRS